MDARALALLLALGPHALAASSACAQRVDFTVARATTSHPLLGEPTGPAVFVSVPFHKRLGASLSLQWLDGSSSGTGVVCAGLVDPAQCPIEPFDQTSGIVIGGLGAPINVVDAALVRLSVHPQLLLASARSRTVGDVTGNRVADSQQHFGFSIGADVGVFPSRRFPLGITVGAGHGQLGPTTGVDCVDCYDVFNRWFSINTVTLGVTLDLDPHRTR